MHKRWQPVRWIVGFATLSLVAAGFAAPATAAPAAAAPALTGIDRLVPKPVAATATGGGAFELNPKSHIVARADARGVGDYLAGILRHATGYPLPVSADRAHPGDVVLDLASGTSPAGHAAEGYTLVTTRDNAVIAADRVAGLFNGVQTLRQLFPPWIDSPTPLRGRWTAEAASISDYPRFGFRGAMLDVARSFQSVDEVKKYIDGIVQFKVNQLHLHLADDQAWRIVINSPKDNSPKGSASNLPYEKLAELGSTGGADVDSGTGAPLGTEPAHRGSYTQDQYKDIVAYAKSRFVTIIPEIDGPGHVNAALAAVPQLNPDGKAKPMNNTGDVGYSTLDAHSPITYEFLKTVWTQLAAMTPGVYLHVGGDEAHVTGHDNYLTYIGKTVPIISGLGKKTIGWNEYADVDLPAGSLIQYWDGSMTSVLKQVAHGSKVVMSPASTAYLDQKYDSASPIGLSWACKGSCDYDRYYNWNPVQGGLREADVAGVEAPLWSETVRGIDQADWLTFPRLASVAEIGWTQQGERQLPDFAARLAALGDRLTVQGNNFYPSPGLKWTLDAIGEDSVVQASLSGEVARFAAPAETAKSVTASIDFGDGTASAGGTVSQPHPATNLSANGLFSVVTPQHRYSKPGTYRGSVTIDSPSGTKVAPFTVTVRS